MTTEGLKRKLARFKHTPMRPGDPDIRPKGRLLIIGGHEDKHHEKLILRGIATRLGRGSKLVIATMATESPREMFEEYESAFRSLDVPHIHHLHVEERDEADSVRALQVLEDATGVFFTGGDQLRITSLVGDTATYSRIFEIFAEGGIVAGTSAGASVMSDTMLIGGGQNGSHRIDDNLRLAPGLGFIQDVVVDQHFAERGRVSRLMAVIAQNPRVIGIGIDENTAIEVRPNRDFRVIGEGGVTVLDGRKVSRTNIAEEKTDRTLSLFGATLHLLSQGDRFTFATREPVLGSADTIEEELGVSSH